MKKILIIGITANPGGIESVLKNYCTLMDHSHFKFDLLCTTHEKLAFEDTFRALGANIFRITPKSKNIFRYRKDLKNFAENHFSEYDVIWLNLCSLSNIDYLIYAKKYNIKKRIIHCHNSQNMNGIFKNLLHYINRFRIIFYPTDFWTCSEEANKWFYGKNFPKKITLINNGIDPALYQFNPSLRKKKRELLKLEDCYVIGNIGRLHFQKNQEFTLSIFQNVLQKIPNAHLILIGQGEDEKKLKKIVAESSLNKYVTFAGIQTDISAWLSSFDLFLFPSRFEGLGIAVLEAEANGLPILLSDKVIPSSIRLNSNLFAFSLERSANEWSEYIYKIHQTAKRLDINTVQSNFKQSPFVIQNEVKKVETLLQ